MTVPMNMDLDRLLKRLHLANARRIWRDLIQRAEAEQWPFQRLLEVLVAEEIAQRSQTRLIRLSRRAHFPFLKTIDDFDFTYQSTVRLALLGSALSPDFVTDGRNLILLGKPGRGKTHLAVAIAYRAIQNGFESLFVTAAELIDHLSGAFRNGQLAVALERYTHPHVVVIDEVGYLTYGTDAANMLFHVVNDRHKRKRSMIFTTNKPLSAWGRVLHDDDLAQAIVDRVLERGRLLQLDGPSMRTKHLGLDDPTRPEAPSVEEVVRISGNSWSEFPEPTATFAAVLVALFKDAAVRWWRRPKLIVSIKPGPPDCVKTEFHYTVQRTALTFVTADCYWLRLWVRNKGSTRADKVQVFAEGLTKRTADGSFKAVEDFLPMNLRWSHTPNPDVLPEVFADGISPAMGKHCDLGHIVDPTSCTDVGESLDGVAPGKTVFALELEVKPNTRSHLLRPGTYRLKLRIGAANARPVTAILELNHTGEWLSDPQRMFSDGLGVRVV